MRIHREDAQNKWSERHVLPSWIFSLSVSGRTNRQTHRQAKTITPSADVKRDGQAASFDMTLEFFPVIVRILGKAGLKLFVTRWACSLCNHSKSVSYIP